MGGLFNLDNPIFTGIGKFVDIVLVSIIWLIVCIPIITIGPATAALYYVIVKVIRRDRGYIFREFFSSFKSNFKVGALATIILLILSFILYFDYQWANAVEGKSTYVFLAVFNLVAFLSICVGIYMFPVLSRFKVTLKQLIKTSLFMSLKHLPSTILIVLIVAIFAYIGYIIIPAMFLAPGLCCLLVSFLFERIFKKYTPEKSENSEESTRDEWYLE